MRPSSAILLSKRLPEFSGAPIALSFQRDMTNLQGQPVYASSFPRRREIVLDEGMRNTPGRLSRIYVHELFHFVWVRLGNPARRSFEGLIREELAEGAPGELGWSAESRKMLLVPRDVEQRTRRWREYVCESFCDTAGWLFGGRPRYAERTLGPEYRARRRAWMNRHCENRTLAV